MCEACLQICHFLNDYTAALLEKRQWCVLPCQTSYVRWAPVPASTVGSSRWWTHGREEVLGDFCAWQWTGGCHWSWPTKRPPWLGWSFCKIPELRTSRRIFEIFGGCWSKNQISCEWAEISWSWRCACTWFAVCKCAREASKTASTPASSQVSSAWQGVIVCDRQINFAVEIENGKLPSAHWTVVRLISRNNFRAS